MRKFISVDIRIDLLGITTSAVRPDGATPSQWISVDCKRAKSKKCPHLTPTYLYTPVFPLAQTGVSFSTTSGFCSATL
jgi:hypothetical protein